METGTENLELALRRSESEVRAVMDNVPGYTWLLSGDGHLLKANRAALDAVSGTHESLVGRPFELTPWWKDAPKVRRLLREAVTDAARGEPTRKNVTLPLADGRDLEMYFRLAPDVGPDGRPAMLVATLIAP